MLVESDSMDIENEKVSLYDEILNENYKLIFIKIYFNEYHQGRIRMLDYLFMKNLSPLSKLLPYLEKKHPEIPWEDAKVYQELKRKYQLEEIDKRSYFEIMDVGDILLIDVGVSQSSPPYLPAVDYYEELNNQVNVKFVGSKSGLTIKAFLPKSMILKDIIKYISKEFFNGVVDEEKILLKAKYKTMHHYSQVANNEIKDGKPLTLGDLMRHDESIIYEESQVPVSELDKLLKLMVTYYSVCTNDCSVEEEIFINKQATVKDLLDKITQDKHFEDQIEQDQKDLADENMDTLIVTLHEKNGKIIMKCTDDLELKNLIKRGSLRVQLWNSENSLNYIEAFCYHTTKDSVVFGTSFLTRFKKYFSNKAIKTHLCNQMNDWEIECYDKTIKITSEYAQKLRFNFNYEKPRESSKTIKIEENQESHIERLDLSKDTKIQIEIIHPTTFAAGYTPMKLS